MKEVTHRWIDRQTLAAELYAVNISELEYVASHVAQLETGRDAARWIFRRINTLLEEKAKCHLL